MGWISVLKGCDLNMIESFTYLICLKCTKPLDNCKHCSHEFRINEKIYCNSDGHFCETCYDKINEEEYENTVI